MLRSPDTITDLASQMAAFTLRATIENPYVNQQTGERATVGQIEQIVQHRIAQILGVDPHAVLSYNDLIVTRRAQGQVREYIKLMKPFEAHQ